MRRELFPIIAGGIALGTIAMISGSAGAKSKILPKGDEFSNLVVPPQDNVFDVLKQISNAVVDNGGPEGLEQFAMIQQDTETGGSGNYLVGLGKNEWFPAWTYPSTTAPDSRKATESKAATAGYRNNPKSQMTSVYNYQNWSFGSGGWFGFLPSTMLGFFKFHMPIAENPAFSPFDIFDPWRSMVGLADYVYRVQKLGQWKDLPQSERNWLAVKRSMRSLSALSDYKGKSSGGVINASTPGRLAKYGYNTSWAKTLVPSKPESWNVVEMWNAQPRLVPSAYLLPNGGMSNLGNV